MDAEETCRQWNKSMIANSPLFLRVNVRTEEEAEELMRWMYSKEDKPMKAELDEISWDKEFIPKEEAELLRMIKEKLCTFGDC